MYASHGDQINRTDKTSTVIVRVPTRSAAALLAPLLARAISEVNHVRIGQMRTTLDAKGT